MTYMLHNADCLEHMRSMPDNSVDVIITSPPYNLNKRASGGGSSKMNYEGWYPDDMPEEEYQEWQKECLNEMMRICKGSIFYNHRIRYAWHSRNKYRVLSKVYHPMQWLSDYPIWCEIVWDRRATTGHANGRFRISDERIFQIKKPHVFHDNGYTTVWGIAPSKNDGHVCSFPEELVSRCIESCSNPGDIVFDPFMGSGTSGVVALRMGRSFYGVELDPEYFSLSKSRIEGGCGV